MNGAAAARATAPRVRPRTVLLLLLGLGALVAALWYFNRPPPGVHLEGTPGLSATGLVRIRYSADSSLEDGAATLDLVAPDGSIETIPLDPDPADQSGRFEVWADLGGHPLSGQRVEARIHILTQAGQSAETPVFALKLPMRDFVNVPARAVEALRREMMEGRVSAADALGRLQIMTDEPDYYGHDMSVFAALTAAEVQLLNGTDARISTMLFRAAQRIDEGSLADNRAQLRNRFRDLKAMIATKDPNMAEAGVGQMVSVLIRLAADRKALTGNEGNAGMAGHLVSRIRSRAENGDVRGAAKAIAALRESIEEEPLRTRSLPAIDPTAMRRSVAAALSALARDQEVFAKDLKALANYGGTLDENYLARANYLVLRADRVASRLARLGAHVPSGLSGPASPALASAEALKTGKLDIAITYASESARVFAMAGESAP